MLQKNTRNRIVATFIGVLVSVVAFAFIGMIGWELFEQDWLLLSSGEETSLIQNLFAIGIPAYLGAYFAQSIGDNSY
jgi:hypothetical protein